MSMWMFWVIAALLLLGGLLLVVPALLFPRREAAGQAGGANLAVYRDQLREAERDLAADVITPERFDQLKAEIERRVLEDTSAADPGSNRIAAPARRTALVLAVLLPLASVSTYLAVGQPDALQVAAAPSVPRVSSTPTMRDLKQTMLLKSPRVSRLDIITEKNWVNRVPQTPAWQRSVIPGGGGRYSRPALQ